MRRSPQRKRLQNAIVARDLMTEDPMVVDENASVADAIDILYSLDIRHLPVMRGKELVGLLSDRDLQPLLRDESSRTRTVASVMNSNVISVDPDASIAEISAALVDNRIGAVPVVDGHEGDLIGIVSYVDVLRDLAKTA